MAIYKDPYKERTCSRIKDRQQPKKKPAVFFIFLYLPHTSDSRAIKLMGNDSGGFYYFSFFINLQRQFVFTPSQPINPQTTNQNEQQILFFCFLFFFHVFYVYIFFWGGKYSFLVIYIICYQKYFTIVCGVPLEYAHLTEKERASNKVVYNNHNNNSSENTDDGNIKKCVDCFVAFSVGWVALSHTKHETAIQQ